MNLHYQLMGAGNDIDLKYVDMMILLLDLGGFSQLERACITLSRASDYRRVSCQVEHFMNTWSQPEFRSAWYISVAVLLARQPCQIYTYPESSEVFQYFAFLSYSAWRKPACL